MSENNSLRVFVDSNILISAVMSSKSLSGQVINLIIAEHQLIICSYSITEVSRVLSRRFPEALVAWDRFLTSLEFELTYTPSDPTSFPVLDIRDEKDIPILVSVLLAQPDILVTGDKDFHTEEIKQHIVVLTPGDFLRSFGHDERLQ